MSFVIRNYICASIIVFRTVRLKDLRQPVSPEYAFGGLIPLVTLSTRGILVSSLAGKMGRSTIVYLCCYARRWRSVVQSGNPRLGRGMANRIHLTRKEVSVSSLWETFKVNRVSFRFVLGTIAYSWSACFIFFSYSQ